MTATLPAWPSRWPSAPAAEASRNPTVGYGFRVDQFTRDSTVYHGEASELGLRPGEWPDHFSMQVTAEGSTRRYELLDIDDLEATYIHRASGTAVLILND